MIYDVEGVVTPSAVFSPTASLSGPTVRSFSDLNESESWMIDSLSVAELAETALTPVVGVVAACVAAGGIQPLTAAASLPNLQFCGHLTHPWQCPLQPTFDLLVQEFRPGVDQRLQ